jgi:predicted transcriptional regulator
VQYSQDAEAAAASPEEGEAAAAPGETSEPEEVSMEEVLGKGGRRAAAENTSA